MVARATNVAVVTGRGAMTSPSPLHRTDHSGTVAYFGHNANDAAVRRRTVAFERAGYRVTGFMHRRGPTTEHRAQIVDLGETSDNAYVQRVKAIFSGARLAMEHKDLLSDADMILARNLDMLAMAVRARYLCGLDTPIVYECLDVHTMLTGKGQKARMMRRLEKSLLRRCSTVVISSPGFEREHFALHYPGAYQSFLVENRLIEGDGFPSRPSAKDSDATRPLRIGWFGNLRCKRTLSLLIKLAKEFPDSVEVSLRGYHAQNVIPDFEIQVAEQHNINYGGRYSAPEDLAEIYGNVDLIWACDWYEEGANSLWLLPNRVYEGGYFATPAFACNGTQTADWLADKAGAIFLDEPVYDSLRSAIETLIHDRTQIDDIQRRLLSLPRDVFVETPETMKTLFQMVVKQPDNAHQSSATIQPSQRA